MDNGATQLRRRVEYTHKFNAHEGRHGWLRLTPAYSVKIVEEIIARYQGKLNVIDPFCGTGTTALVAMNYGHHASTLDINPFLVWLARAKTTRYSNASIEAACQAGESALALALNEAVAPVEDPPIHNIARWWSDEPLRFLIHLKAAINQVASDERAADLLNVAFCRALIRLSNASFNHQSMSFKNPSDNLALFNCGETFLDDLQFVLNGAAQNPVGTASVLQGDAKHMLSACGENFDLVITSPPYANRMSYIRELRPYMYWMGYLSDKRDAGNLDWKSIGGTWGVATSRLATWQPNQEHWIPDRLVSALKSIASDDNHSGRLLSNYVAKYFADISAHLDGLRSTLNGGARVHYIIGNSSFYGVLVPTERIYAEMLTKYGFKDVSARPVRKRNSKKELVEYEVVATWPARRRLARNSR